MAEGLPSRDRRAYRRGVLLVLLGSLCSSWIGLGVRMVEEASPWQILVYRSLSLTLFLALVLAIRQPGQFAAAFRQAGTPGVIGGLGLAAALCGSVVAIDRAPVANALFLLAAAPFIAALLGLAFLKEKVRLVTWLAMALAFGGVFVMVLEGLSLGYFWGNVAGLIAAFGLALYVFCLRWGRLSEMLPLSIVAGLLGLLTAGVICLAEGSGFTLTVNDLLVSLAMGVFQLGVALVLITAGSKHVPSAELALLTLTEMVVAPFWVWLVYGETVTLLTLAGGALVLIAIVCDAVSGMKNSPQQA